MGDNETLFGNGEGNIGELFHTVDIDVIGDDIVTRRGIQWLDWADELKCAYFGWKGMAIVLELMVGSENLDRKRD